MWFYFRLVISDRAVYLFEPNWSNVYKAREIEISATVKIITAKA